MRRRERARPTRTSNASGQTAAGIAVDFLQHFTEKGHVRTINATNVPTRRDVFLGRLRPSFRTEQAASMLPLASRRGARTSSMTFSSRTSAQRRSQLGNQAHGHGIEWYFGLVDETPV